MAQPNKKVSSTFTINKILNLTNNNDHDTSVKQVPFFLNNVGVPTIKGKITTPAYTATT
jgi:hypothetical protein